MLTHRGSSADPKAQNIINSEAVIRPQPFNCSTLRFNINLVTSMDGIYRESREADWDDEDEEDAPWMNVCFLNLSRTCMIVLVLKSPLMPPSAPAC